MIILFLTSSLICLLILGMFEILCETILVFYLPNNPLFSIDFRGFFHYVTHSIGPPQSLKPWFVTLHLCQPLDPMGIHLFCCAHGGKNIVSHDIVHDAFAFITRDIRLHILHEHIHVHLPLILQCTHQWVNIGVLMDGV
jgi:hypothetical protein